MTYGFKATNKDTGGVQIDENYRNFMLRGVYTAQTTSPDKSNYQTFIEYPKNGYSYPNITLPSPSTHPLVFYPADVFTGMGALNVARNTTFKYAVFDVPTEPSAPFGHGALTRTAAGAIAWYSGYRYLRVHTVLSGSNYITSPLNVALATNKKWGFCFFKWAGRWRMDDDRAYDSIGSNLRFYRVRREIMAIKLAAGALTSIDMSFMDDSDYAFPDQPDDHWDTADRSYAILVADMSHIAEW